jgi:hypothetical protein
LIVVAAGACAASFAVAPALASGSSDTSDLHVAGVGLKADSNEVAVEGITLDHEGFEIL